MKEENPTRDKDSSSCTGLGPLNTVFPALKPSCSAVSIRQSAPQEGSFEDRQSPGPQIQ